MANQKGQKGQGSLFEGMRLTLDNAIQISLENLRHYAKTYSHWAIAYSGGKDSSATAAFILWAIKTNQVPKPESLTILYADTRQELPPLQRTAVDFLAQVNREGFRGVAVMPQLDKRFYVYMLGRGVPPPKNRFRWCTDQLKGAPMIQQLEETAVRHGLGWWDVQGILLPTGGPKLVYQPYPNKGKMLMITGVRMGESAVRDQRIAVSCSKDSGECGQGWLQVGTPESVADTFAPLLHWRLCHVYDWLYFHHGKHGYPILTNIADVYGDDDVRTGCIGCNLVDKDTGVENLIRLLPEKWGHLKPLLELKGIFRELQKPQNRLRKVEPELRQDGTPAKNLQRMGPLTMEARQWAFDKVLAIQQAARVDLINQEEQERIKTMWANNQWPQGWSGDEPRADLPHRVLVIGNDEEGNQAILEQARIL